MPSSDFLSESEESDRAGPSREQREHGDRAMRGSAPDDEDRCRDAAGLRRGRRHSRRHDQSDHQEKGKSKGKGKGGGKKGSKKGSKDNRSSSGGKKGDKGDGRKGKESRPDMRTIIQEEMAKMIPMAASMMSMMNPVSVNSMAMGSAGPSLGPTHASTETAIPRNQNDLGWYEEVVLAWKRVVA